MTPIHKNPVLTTVLLLALSAAVGGVVVYGFAFVSAMSAVILTGPLGWLTLGPVVIAYFSIAVTWVLLGIPAWAILGGYFFAAGSSGSNGSAARSLGITFFSDDHPITIRTNELAKQVGLDGIPWVGWYPSDDINAMAIGENLNNAMICVSQGAVDRLSIRDLDAILAHEIAHVASQDMQRMTYARGVQESLTWFLGWRKLKKFARWVFTPLSELYVLKFSRDREFAADAIAAELTSPEDIQSALVAIHMDQLGGLTPQQYAAVQINGRARSDIWSTHPETIRRVEALKLVKKSQLQES